MKLALALVGVLALAACGEGGTGGEAATETEPAPQAVEDTPAAESADAAKIAPEPAPPTSGQSLACGLGEDTLFSCKVAGGKTVAVCGKDGNAQYRFGAANAEITLDNGKFASVPYSGGGESQIAFTNGDTSYIVFSRIVRTNFAAGEPNDPEFTDGVTVLRGDDVIAERRCTGEVQSVDVMAGENYGGVTQELFF